VTAHRRNREFDLDWRALARPRQTLCIYVGLSVIGELTSRLIAASLARRTPVALVDSGTTRRQRVIAGRLADLGTCVTAASAEGPALLIIGEVAAVALRKPASRAAEPRKPVHRAGRAAA
jgi:uroporphyrin-III C-methyltransferase/precorrin-2 dehydrogenase/sirohydrochlorin ferrochelatase